MVAEDERFIPPSLPPTTKIWVSFLFCCVFQERIYNHFATKWRHQIWARRNERLVFWGKLAHQDKTTSHSRCFLSMTRPCFKAQRSDVDVWITRRLVSECLPCGKAISGTLDESCRTEKRSGSRGWSSWSSWAKPPKKPCQRCFFFVPLNTSYPTLFTRKVSYVTSPSLLLTCAVVAAAVSELS